MAETIFVTGATGLLGAELVKQLLEEERARIVCLVRDQVPRSRFFAEGLDRQVVTVRGDIRDEALLERVLNEYDVSTVYHLAAQTLVEKANALPAETHDVNIRGTWSLLEAVRRRGTVRATLVASSDKAYGALSGERYDESHPLVGTYPYDVSKSCTDLLSRSYARSYEIKVGITRCGNFFGPGDLNESRIFPSTILSVLRGERPVIRSDGKFVRDYIFVSDAAAAYRTLARYVAERGTCGEAYNFSYGIQLTVLDVVEKILREMGSDLRPVIESRASNEIVVQCLDSAKARKELGWSPQVGFDAGLKRTIAWYVEHFKKTSPLRKAA